MTTALSTTPRELRHAQLLTRYKAWADDLTYKTVVLQQDEELLKERKTTFKTIIHTLHHTYIVDDIFRAHVESRDHGYSARTVETPPQIDELRESVLSMNRWWVEFADASSDEDLAQSVLFAFLDGTNGVMTRQQIILHVVQHASYHRGYVDDMMYQIPVTPPATDLTVFFREMVRD